VEKGFQWKKWCLISAKFYIKKLKNVSEIDKSAEHRLIVDLSLGLSAQSGLGTGGISTRNHLLNHG
jgi:hypothetical protein